MSSYMIVQNGQRFIGHQPPSIHGSYIELDHRGNQCRYGSRCRSPQFMVTFQMSPGDRQRPIQLRQMNMSVPAVHYHVVGDWGHSSSGSQKVHMCQPVVLVVPGGLQGFGNPMMGCGPGGPGAFMLMPQ